MLPTLFFVKNISVKVCWYYKFAWFFLRILCLWIRLLLHYNIQQLYLILGAISYITQHGPTKPSQDKPILIPQYKHDMEPYFFFMTRFWLLARWGDSKWDQHIFCNMFLTFKCFSDVFLQLIRFLWSRATCCFRAKNDFKLGKCMFSKDGQKSRR